LGHTRVVFYCHFPDKLLANGAFVEGNLVKRKTNFLKWLYRQPMDWLEEVTTSQLLHLIYDKGMVNYSSTEQADVILANSKFTAQVFKAYFPSISQNPSVIYPGINISAYEAQIDLSDLDVSSVAR
jgi:alpha-1,3/alpha-1,6-mannosyltransferase